MFVGASVPFGAVQLGPTSIPQSWDWCSGYHSSDSTVIGFSHTHLSGTGIGDLFDITLMPVVGAEGPVVAESRQQTNGEARRDEGLLVPRPMAEAHTIRQIPQTDLVLIAPSVLREEFEAVGRDAVLRTLGKDEHELFGIVGQGIAHGVAHLPLAGMLADVLVLPSETSLQRMAVEFRSETQDCCPYRRNC